MCVALKVCYMWKKCENSTKHENEAIICIYIDDKKFSKGENICTLNVNNIQFHNNSVAFVCNRN